MGWDGQYYLEKPDFKAIAIQRNTFKHVGEDRQPTGGESKVLAAVKVGNVVYMAVDYNPSPDALQNKSPNVAHKGLINFRYTYGMVTLCRWSRPRGAREGEAMFKEVSETMGPCDYKCPKSILNLLTPCEEVVRLAKAAGCDYAVARYSAGEEGYAYNWRMKCQNHAT
ncbi:hypothetical protein EBZ39_10125, partial [bacterium]|nr:hypothetical protein [bacterium]